MAPFNVKLGAGAKKDLREGRDIMATTLDDRTISISWTQVAHALAQFQAGQEVSVLALEPSTGKLIEVGVT